MFAVLFTSEGMLLKIITCAAVVSCGVMGISVDSYSNVGKCPKDITPLADYDFRGVINLFLQPLYFTICI